MGPSPPNVEPESLRSRCFGRYAGPRTSTKTRLEKSVRRATPLPMCPEQRPRPTLGLEPLTGLPGRWTRHVRPQVGRDRRDLALMRAPLQRRCEPRALLSQSPKRSTAHAGAEVRGIGAASTPDLRRIETLPKAVRSTCETATPKTAAGEARPESDFPLTRPDRPPAPCTL